MDTIIATDGLTKIFGGKIVVNRLNLRVPQGAIFALLGGNGAGKSTTIRMLTGLLPPDAGSASILGEDCWSAAIPLRHRVGYVPEKPRFYDWMTVREIGWFTAGFHKVGFFARYADLVQRFRLDPAPRPRVVTPRSAWPWPWPRTPKC
jgi:ABC-2 type transport system ATP-binding protein